MCTFWCLVVFTADTAVWYHPQRVLFTLAYCCPTSTTWIKVFFAHHYHKVIAIGKFQDDVNCRNYITLFFFRCSCICLVIENILKPCLDVAQHAPNLIITNLS